MTLPDVLNFISVITLFASVLFVWRISRNERWQPHVHVFGIIFMGLAGFRLIHTLLVPRTSEHVGITAVENLITVLIILSGILLLYRSLKNAETSRRVVIRQQEQKLADLVNNLPDVFIRIDRTLRIVLVNNAVEKEFWVKPVDLLGKTLYEVALPAENIEHIREIIFSVLETGHPRIDEISLHMQEGTQQYLTYGVPEFTDGSHQETALFILRNITEKVLANEAMRESEERFRRVVRANPMGMHFYTLKDDNRLVLVDHNASADSILGISHAALIGKTIEEAFPGLIETEVPDTYRRLARDGGQWHSEQVIYDEGMISGAFAVDAFQISPMNMVATFTDITERKRQEEAIQLSNARMKIAVQTAGLGVWEMDLASEKTIWWSDMYPLFGYHPEETGETATQFFGRIVLPEDLRMIYDIFDSMQHKSLTQTPPDVKYLLVDNPYTFRARRPDNSEVVLIGSMAFQRDAEGNFKRVVGTALDISRQKQAEQMIQQQVQELELLRTIDQSIISNNDVTTCITELVKPIQDFFGGDAAEVLLYNQEEACVTYVAGYGYISDKSLVSFPVTQGTPWQSIISRKLIYQTNIDKNPELQKLVFYRDEKMITCYTVPLLTPNRVQGVLQVFYRSRVCLEESKVDFLTTVAGQLAIAVEKSQLWDSLQRTLSDLMKSYETTLESLVHALDLRDNETEHHTRRVTELSIATAHAMGAPQEQVDNIRRGALLHDVGKIGIPDSILHKEGPLTEEEWTVMRMHPTKAYNMLQKIDLFRDALDIPYCHHERWNGSGYPRGLKGEEIPLAARIFAVVDVWDALTSDRPYRKRWTEAQAAEHLCSNAGVLFDPQVTETFLSVVKKNK